ncbi:MAG TPA: prepilin-type N-terminal cleavage/methylation domain-containing protein [Candidatus Binataceae bacterium]|nr:prepilin-type N-terminal cleavage/methylation domain-containing protein [Candidatus Binataceae bacterium]
MARETESRRQRRGGPRLAPAFTLIELMVAIAILALIFVMLADSFHAVATGKVNAEARIATAEQGRHILWQMSNELRGSVQTLFGPPSIVLILGQGRMENNVPLDDLSFSTIDPGHRRSIEDFGAEDTITYTTARNPNQRGWFILTRTQRSSLLSSGEGGPGVSLELADNLLSLHFRYFDGNIWNESWNSGSLPPQRQLPQAVMIDLVLAQPNGAPLPLSTVVTLPMAFNQW